MAEMRRNRNTIAGLMAVWGMVLTLGMVLMAAYAAGPGDPGAPPSRWPVGSAIPRDSGRPILLMFLHPRCPCSRASIGELATLRDRCGNRVAMRAVLVRPEGAGSDVDGDNNDDDWTPPDLLAELAAIPGLKVVVDVDGVEARRFAVATSGHVLLYGTTGRLTFDGGITAARGMRGDNLGRDVLLERIMGNREAVPASPVFGCPLANPGPRTTQGGR